MKKAVKVCCLSGPLPVGSSQCALLINKQNSNPRTRYNRVDCCQEHKFKYTTAYRHRFSMALYVSPNFSCAQTMPTYLCYSELQGVCMITPPVMALMAHLRFHAAAAFDSYLSTIRAHRQQRPPIAHAAMHGKPFISIASVVCGAVNERELREPRAPQIGNG